MATTNEIVFKALSEVDNLESMREEMEKHVLARQAKYDAKSAPNTEDNEKLKKLEDAYASRKMKEVFDGLLECENPIKQAILDLNYKVLKVTDKEEKIDDAKFMTVSIIERSIDINPYVLCEYAKKSGKNIGITWTYMSQKLNWLMCCKLGQDLGDPKWATSNLKNISSSFMMEKIARDLDLAGTTDEDGKKHPDPLSNKQMVNTISTIITAMVGEDITCQTRDVKYLENAWSKKGKHAQIVTPKTRTFALVLRDIAWRNITQSNYELLSKNLKKQK